MSKRDAKALVRHLIQERPGITLATLTYPFRQDGTNDYRWSTSKHWDYGPMSHELGLESTDLSGRERTIKNILRQLQAEDEIRAVSTLMPGVDAFHPIGRT